MAPRLTIRDIEGFERPVPFAEPFRFGAVRVTGAPQAFVRVAIEVEGHGPAIGASAEMMIPKWFDKRPERAPDETVDDLRLSLALARDLYLSDRRSDTAFGHHAARVKAQVEAGRRAGLPPLAALFGPAEIDKAILDALLRATGQSVFAGLRANVVGLDARLTPDLETGEIVDALAAAKPGTSIALRHTVGLDDHLDGAMGLGAIAAATGARYFKLKLGGEPAADADRLAAIGTILDGLPGRSAVTLDANEQYGDLASLAALLHALAQDARLAAIERRLLYIEQPLHRTATFTQPLGPLAARPFIIDEADDSYDAFPRAQRLGYRGVSSKACKGLYKSLLNGVRVRRDPNLFMTAEDLTCQAGLAVQQDCALAAVLGLTHIERNGHRYGGGFGAAPEAAAFRAAHPDLYEGEGQAIRLRITDGTLALASLAVPGFATAVHPDWAALSPLSLPTAQEHVA